MYQIQIIKIEPRTEEEIKILEERNEKRKWRNGGLDIGFNGGFSKEDYFKTLRVLDVEITDEEFKSIKKAVMEVM